MKIKDMPIVDRPRERALKYGVSSLSNEELLSIILRSGTSSKSVKELSLEILNICSINKFNSLTLNRLLEIKGMGKVKCIELLSVIEFSNRMKNDSSDYEIKIKSSLDIFDNYKYLFINKNQELFYCLYLNNKNIVIDSKLLFMGTINKSIVHPREIFKYAYLESASGIICIHNHPSGDVTPSREDINFTKSLVELGKINGIPIVDHIIIGKDKYFSFVENRYI